MEPALDGREGPLSRRERERARHRQEIMDAAVRVFARRGYASATLDEVAQEAEFSKGTLYLHFASKEDLLYNILLTNAQGFHRNFRETLVGKRSFREELRDLFLHAADTSFRNQDMTRVIMAQFSSGFSALSEEAGKAMWDIHEATVQCLRERTRQAFEEGELRDIPLEAITSMIHGSLDGMMMSRWNIESVEKVRKAVDVFIDILFGGIARERKNCA